MTGNYLVAKTAFSRLVREYRSGDSSIGYDRHDIRPIGLRGAFRET
jgi:hypothetical protein